MFVTLRRYQKWFWAGIIAVIIPSFVVFFSPDAAFKGRHRGNYGSINGRTIAYDEYAAAYHETELQFLFNYGTWPSGNEAKQFGFDMDRETQRRLFLIEKMKEFQIHPSDEAVNKWFATTFSDRRTHEYNAESVKNFVRRIQSERGMREMDFLRFASHEVGIQQLISVFGMNGKFATPLEAEQAYRIQNEQVEAEAAIFSSSNYLASVKTGTNELRAYYTNRLTSYQIPRKVQVRYIQFPATNFLAEANQLMAAQTNLTQIIDSMYRQQGPNFYTDTNGAALPEAQAKEKIKNQIQQEFAMQSARKKAGSFAVELFKLTPAKADNLNVMAASNNMPVAVTEPFTESAPPRSIKVLASFTKAAFALTPEEPMTPPLVGEDGVYIAALEKTIPAETPAFEAVQARVAEDYKRYHSILEARKAGEVFQQAVTNGIAAGKNFAAICAEAKVTPVKLPKFSMSARSLDDMDKRLNLSSVQGLAAELTPGKVSRLDFTAEGGYVLHLISKSPVDKAAMDKELPEFLKNMRQSRQYEAFSDWITRAASQARLTGPPSAEKSGESSAN